MSERYGQNEVRDAAVHGQSKARRMIDESTGAIPAIGDAARSAADVLRTAGRAAASVISDWTEEARGTGVSSREQLASQVRDQPIAAVLIAAGVGLIAGMFLTRN